MNSPFSRNLEKEETAVIRHFEDIQHIIQYATKQLNTKYASYVGYY